MVIQFGIVYGVILIMKTDILKTITNTNPDGHFHGTLMNYLNNNRHININTTYNEPLHIIKDVIEISLVHSK